VSISEEKSDSEKEWDEINATVSRQKHSPELIGALGNIFAGKSGVNDMDKVFAAEKKFQDAARFK
jgi:hypothetical protein